MIPCSWPWRPHLPESIDGLPLATAVSDFAWTFPYDRLPASSLLAFLLRPAVPTMLIAAYVAPDAALPSVCRAMGIDGRSSAFVMAVALHNLVLAVFSAVVFVNSWPIVIHHIMEKGAMSTYCDSDGSLWASGMGAWCTVFYVSKYYEWIDTLILIAKGKNPSFLQLYHHAGIVLTMWGGVVSQGVWLLIVVLLNSGIHALMYSYFLLKTIDPTRQITAAKYLTVAQIGQFFTGILYTLPIHFFGAECDSAASRLVCGFIEAYAVGLIFLFASFARTKYKKS